MNQVRIPSAPTETSPTSRRSPMRKIWRTSLAAGSALTLAGGIMLMAGTAASADDASAGTPPQTLTQHVGGSQNLGRATAYAVTAEAAATIPNNTLWGNLTAGAAVTDPGTMFCGVVDADPTLDPVGARSDALTAYNNLHALTTFQSDGLDLTNDDLGGQTIAPGVYHRSAAFAVTSTATFDAQGDPNAIFVMQTDAALNTTAGTVVKLINGARADEIFWVVPAATTLGAGSTFYGTILSQQAVTVGAGSVLYGRAFSITAAVTLGDAVDVGPGVTDNSGNPRPDNGPAARMNDDCSGTGESPSSGQ